MRCRSGRSRPPFPSSTSCWSSAAGRSCSPRPPRPGGGGARPCSPEGWCSATCPGTFRARSGGSSAAPRPAPSSCSRPSCGPTSSTPVPSGRSRSSTSTPGSRHSSAAGYRRFRRLFAPALARVDAVAAQTREDAARLVATGARPERVVVTGNTKLDVAVPGRRARERAAPAAPDRREPPRLDRREHPRGRGGGGARRARPGARGGAGVPPHPGAAARGAGGAHRLPRPAPRLLGVAADRRLRRVRRRPRRQHDGRAAGLLRRLGPRVRRREPRRHRGAQPPGAGRARHSRAHRPPYAQLRGPRRLARGGRGGAGGPRSGGSRPAPSSTSCATRTAATAWERRAGGSCSRTAGPGNGPWRSSIGSSRRVSS